MAEILLTSEAFVKGVTSVSDNLYGKYLKPSIREAQECGLKGILGETLTEKLKALVKDGTIEAEANAAYKALLDKCQYYLAYTSIVEVANKVSFKIGNFGVAKSSDENLQVASQGEIAKMMDYYQSKADFHCYDLQNYVLANRLSFPELTQNTAHKIKADLRSAASCGIFLGGARGKLIRR